jgi:ADP-ribose pyrophosphatase YjhB (NUDIX family)
VSSGSRALVGLLSEPVRLKVASALALGASSPADVVTATGLGAREVAAALRRLESGGLVSTERGRIRLHEEAFKDAARGEAPPPPTDAELSADAETAAVLRAFVPHGRIQSLPVSREKRRLLLGHLARLLEPGVRYSEREVNGILSPWHDDHAMLRRYLYDEGFVDRRDGVYWRIGGYVDTEPPPPEPEKAALPWHPRIGSYALAEQAGSVLLTRLSRGDMRGRWNLPGGGADFGERPVDTLHRELHEETGLSGRIEGILDVDAFPAWKADGPDWFLAVIYRVTITGGTLGVVETGGSSDEVAWVPLDGLDPATLTPRAALVVERFSGR